MSQHIFKTSTIAKEFDIRDYIVDTEEKTIDLTKFTNINRIKYRCKNIPIAIGKDHVEYVVIKNAIRNVQNLVKADYYEIPSVMLCHSAAFRTAKTLKIVGKNDMLILGEFNREKFPDLVHLNVKSVDVDTALLKEISNHTGLVALTFGSCKGLKNCDWNKLNLPNLKIFVPDTDSESKMKDLGFLDKHPKLQILSLNVSKKCINVECLSKLPLKFLRLKKMFSSLKLPSIVMLRLDKVIGGEQPLDKEPELKMIKIDSIANKKALDDLKIREGTFLCHNKMSLFTRLINTCEWNVAFTNLYEGMAGQVIIETRKCETEKKDSNEESIMSSQIHVEHNESVSDDNHEKDELIESDGDDCEKDELIESDDCEKDELIETDGDHKKDEPIDSAKEKNLAEAKSDNKNAIPITKQELAELMNRTSVLIQHLASLTK